MSDVEDQARISLPMAAIEAFCEKWQITEFALFGSVLREDFGPESDIDVLVTYAPDADRSLANHLAMYDEIEVLFGRKVDLINRESIERSRNYIRRRAILGSARTIYELPGLEGSRSRTENAINGAGQGR
jgi:predicted nucleotidyltransferase